MKTSISRWSLVIALLGLASGCYSLQEHIDEMLLQKQIRHQAEIAWNSAFACYRDIDHRADFRRGFLDGYVSVANGGSGCVPAIAPRHYRSHCFANDEGQCSTRGWFDGFAHGAIAAEQDGASGFNKIMISPAYASQCQQTEHGEPEYGEPEHFNSEDQFHLDNLGTPPSLLVPTLPSDNTEHEIRPRKPDYNSAP